MGRPSARQTRVQAIGARAAAFVRSLPDHRLLDRLIRGRIWIPLLGVMLAGIVAMQVEVLKLGASMGRSLELNTTLSAKNASLRESVASLGDDQRIEQLAANMGMVMPPPQSVGFLTAHRNGDATRAAANIRQPDSSSFLLLTTSNGAVVTAQSLAAWDQFGTTSTATSTPTSTSTLPAGTAPTSAAPTSTSDATSAQGGPQAPALAPAPGPSTGSAGVATPTADQSGG